MARILILATSLFLSANAFARNLDAHYEKAPFKIGKAKFIAYIADTDQKRAEGLMFVEKLGDNSGMLFVFEDSEIRHFWMKNTLLPLSIGFFDKKGALVDVQEMSVSNSLMSNEVPSYQSKAPAVFALEMNSGWFTKHKIKAGARIEIAGAAKSALLRRQLQTK